MDHRPRTKRTTAVTAIDPVTIGIDKGMMVPVEKLYYLLENIITATFSFWVCNLYKTHRCTQTHANIHTNTYIYIHTDIQTHRHTYTNTHIDRHVYTIKKQGSNVMLFILKNPFVYLNYCVCTYRSPSVRLILLLCGFFYFQIIGRQANTWFTWWNETIIAYIHKRYW